MTAESMHQVLRNRLRSGRNAWPDILMSEIPPGAHTKEAMLEALRARFQAQSDRGVVNLMKNLVLEPRNPFEPERRRLPKREVVGVGALFVVLFCAVAWFNFLAR